MSLRTIPIRRSGNRVNLFMGGDREMVMFSGLLSAVLILATQDVTAILAGIGLWFFSIKALRLMAKSDPYMRQVYLRHRQYHAHYPARSTPFFDNNRGYQ